MIQIENITIANYRSFKNSGNKIDKLNRINVMVGKNNVGKTNVLRAMFLFFNPDTYDFTVDRNMVKQLTGGSTRDPKITITFIDTDIIENETTKYIIACDLNDREEKQYYSVNTSDERIKTKFKDSSSIKKYLDKKIKCVYLSTTDEDIDKQSESLINDLILQYYKKQNKEIKQSIEDFEKAYKSLITTFKNNIDNIEKDLSEQFIGISDTGIAPKLTITSNKAITSFLLENVKLQLDDSYMQDIGNKGAGIQRASIIMLSIYLLNQIYSNTSKIILLDEPEAFLYPLLERSIKEKLEKSIVENKDMQIFLTSHSRSFLQEMNNEQYTFHYLYQNKEEKEYSRSKNDIDINKYTIVESMNRHNKYNVLKNYGLLDDINDYEYIIICEGETDKNYILEILSLKDDIPQIRYSKYSDYMGEKIEDLDYDYIGKGASSFLPILIYLDHISQIDRKVFVLFDGDSEGQKFYKKIKEKEFQHLTIKKFILPKDLEIEDVVYNRDVFVDRVLEVTPEFQPYEKQYRDIIMNLPSDRSVITQTEKFIEGNAINSVNIYKIKDLISKDLKNTKINSKWLLDEIDDFIYS